MAQILEVTGLTKVFQKANGTKHIAVDNIDFYLNDGEIFSFLGPNGAGKSTTINMLTTQLTPTKGKIQFAGVNIIKEPTFARSQMGIVAQHNNLDRGLTAIENLVYHGKYFGMTSIDSEKKAISLLHDFGLFDWKDDYVKSYSGGMAQRLKIARAIMHEPKLLFLDEPTTGLDPAYREVLWEHVLHLNKKNHTTVFLTTHYMEEPERFSDRVAIYNTGVIKALGTIAELSQLVPSKSVIYLTLNELSDDSIQQIITLDSVQQAVRKDEKTVTIYPKNSILTLNQIINFVEQHHLSLENIQLNKTTLDDIFIHLTTNEKGAK